MLMNIKAMFKATINSLERNLEFTNLQQEAPAVVPGNRPGPGWPGRGEIQLAGVSLRYRPDLPLVLSNISITIGEFYPCQARVVHSDPGGGQKVGVVGRTGAGKSSLISALLRLVELDSGRILIDGLDVRSVGSNSLCTETSNHHLAAPWDSPT